MRGRSVLAALVGAAVLVLMPVAAQGANPHANYHAVCPGPPAGYAHCHALVVTDSHGKPVSHATPAGLSPSTIESAYGFSNSQTAGAGLTIAIVDAYDDPSAESDLAAFSTEFDLPACTTANGCFKKVNQSGGTGYPRANSGWGLEISLDIQWAHAIAPGAKILLVEASSPSFSNLLAAEDYASAHAQYVSNSWGANEFNGESSYDSHFKASGVSFFVSAGDAGLPAEYPSSSPNVISVGGTTLHFSGGTFTSETGWSDGGGGCSAYETATPAQSSFGGYSQVNCGGKRATPDVSLDADPASGVSVYDSYGYGGWIVVGGTSASSPMWAARSADQHAVVNAAYVYGNNIPFRDITSGNNGAPCMTGFDLCTGRGSWNDGGGSAPTPDFSVSSSTGSVTVTQGATAQYPITITELNGFKGDVTLSESSNPAGVTGAFSPNPAASSSTLAVPTATVAPGGYTLTITGTSGSLVHSSTVSLTVQAPQSADFGLSASPSSRSVKRGRNTSYSIAITRTGNFGGTVGLTLSGAPSGVSASFNPSSTGGGSSTLSITTSRNASRGTYTLTITGTSGSLVHSTTVSLTLR